jgi:predicted transcriptional regulator
MKNATLPALRVEPSFRRALEEMLEENETLSGFMEEALRAGVARRQAQREFLARGLASRDEAAESGVYHSASAVLDELDDVLRDKS